MLLGSAIISLQNIDATWVKKTIRKIQSDDRGTRVGFAFELLLFASLANAGHRVVLAPDGTPKYDGDVYVDGVQVRLSLKSFAASHHERDFRHKATAIDTEACNIAKDLGKHWLGLYAATNPFPDSERTWVLLRNRLRASIADPGEHDIAGIWRIITRLPAPADIDFQSFSHNVMIVAPHKEHEKKNFLDKIAESCVDLDEAAAGYDPAICSLVLVRLSEEAPMEEYVPWIKEYLNQAGRRIAGVWLYQSTVASYVPAGKPSETSIHHYLLPIMRDGVTAPNMQIRPTVGIAARAPIRKLFMIKGANGNEQEASLAGHHTYMNEEKFRAVHLYGRESKTITLDAYPGSVTHAVIYLPGGGREVEMMPNRDHTHLFLFE
jgi:hypothetical protein